MIVMGLKITGIAIFFISSRQNRLFHGLQNNLTINALLFYKLVDGVLEINYCIHDCFSLPAYMGISRSEFKFKIGLGYSLKRDGCGLPFVKFHFDDTVYQAFKFPQKGLAFIAAVIRKRLISANFNEATGKAVVIGLLFERAIKSR